MGAQVIEKQAWSAASPDEVFAVLADGSTWPEWSALGSFERERPGTGGAAPNGLGEVRHFTTGRVHSREEVVVFEPGRRFGYVLLSGIAIKDYRAEVELVPSDGGTAIQWRSTFRRSTMPGFSRIYRSQLAKFIEPLVDDLAKEADRVSGSQESAPR